jgi:hypothetical protein
MGMGNLRAAARRVGVWGLLVGGGWLAYESGALAQSRPDPYQDYSTLDAALGEGFLTRLYNYYKLEWGKAGPPTDPNAAPSAREGWPRTPQSTPPMPFTEWPYGGTTAIGVTRPNSVDSPLMVTLGNTSLGKILNDAHIQIYGWVNPGGNLSTNSRRQGNQPAAYDYTPNTVQLDQAVLYIERLPDTVQTDRIDWGFRLSGLYGTDYRYTTAFGIASDQLLKHNTNTGWDVPMVYGDLYIPRVAEGLTLRLGRFISVPDIEAQLAPNNYMYSHSLTYTFDNFTNTGLLSTLAVTKNLFLQLGVVMGSDTAFWNFDQRQPNLFPNPLYPGRTYLRDPGAKPSATACLRYQTDSGNDTVYLCANGINDGVWGYNNLQWTGGTYYHKFSDKWHVSTEAYTLSQDNVPNVRNPAAAAALANGGTPFSPQNGFVFNAPNGAQCGNPNVLSCTARALAFLGYLNYRATDLDNISFRGEFYDDMQGQRTGTKSRYVEFGLGWQHWFSPQVYIRPEITFYKSLDAPAFNGNAPAGIPPNKDYAVIGAADLIWKF